METLSDLFQFILEREKTLVFGNLSRYPNVLSDFIRSKYDSMEIVIVSRYYTFPTTADDNIRSVAHIQAKNLQCDLLVYCEPYPYETVEKPPNVSHMVVFTSHLAFPSNRDWANVCFFHDGDLSDLMDKTHRLLRLQDGSLQSHSTSKVRIDRTHVQFLGPSETFHLKREKEKTYFVINLTSLTSPHSMLLRFWDAFDFMIRHFESVDRWLICFSEKGGKKAYEQFTQETIDKLFCKKFENGNKTELKSILSFVPFYKSGVVDRRFDQPIDEFCDLKIIAPKTLTDAFKMVVVHNVEQLVGSVHILKD